MRTKPLFLFLILICLIGIAFNSFASNGSKPNTSVQATELMHKSNALFFEENKGQLKEFAPNPRQRGRVSNTDVKYYGHSNGVYLYCKPGMLSFVFTKVENSQEQISEATGQPSGFPLSGKGEGGLDPLKSKIPQPTTITTSRMDMVLINSNPSAIITATDQQEYYENFYTTGDADHGITNVHTYKTVTYKDIYPNIDMILSVIPSSAKASAGEEGMEYSFLVHPGGNVGDIQLRWDGAECEKALESGGVKHSNSLGSMEESRPKSYVEGKDVETSFIKKGLFYSFEISGYDKTKDLLIDPSLVWGTYFGGNGQDQATDVSTDGSGNGYITGSTKSSSGIATSGAYQTSYAGNEDAFLAKFSSAGTLSWATYYGDTAIDIASAVSTDGSGKIYIVGYTGSPGIATSGAYQTSFAGNYDAFLAKFNSVGTISWATYYGGSGYDKGLGVCTDASGKVYITGSTVNSSGIATSGAYQTSNAGTGSADAFLAKFSSAGAISWATYYGGDGGESGDAICTDISGNVYITGGTYLSRTGIATSGAYQTSYGGGIDGGDAFLAKFSSVGAISWATYYGGGGGDIGSGVGTDASGDVYITGGTGSSTGMATSGAYQPSNAGGNDAFLAKFSSAGALSWATYYGGSSDEQANAISTDGYGNVYITGFTLSTSGMATSGAYQTSAGGSSYADAFLARFSSAGSMSWATYYGGSGDDEAYGISADGYANVYITGTTASSSGIASFGAYQTSNAGNVDAFLAKFSFSVLNDVGINSIKSLSGSACPGLQSVKVILENYGTSTLTSDSIYWKINGTAQTPVKWTGSLKTDSTTIVTLGTYNFSSGSNTVGAWSAKPNGVKDSVPENDTAKITLVVSALPAAAVISDTAICSGTAISIGAAAVSGSSYSWSSSVSGFSSTSSNPSVSPTSTASYTLTETNSNGCVKSNSVTINVNALPAASVIPNTAICSGSAISIGAAAVAGSIYSWSSSASGFSSTSSNPSVSPSSTASYTLTEINANGCTKSNSVTINVNALPAAAVIPNTAICSGSAISIGAAAVGGSRYSWSSSVSGFSSTSSNPSVTPTSTASYTLTETNASGCVKSNSVTITVNPLPIAYWVEDNLSADYYFHAEDSLLSKSSYTWDFGDGSAGATGFDVSHIFPKNKSYTVKLTVTDSFGCINSDDSSINVTVSGINPTINSNLYSLSIYPNPFSSKTLINFTLPQTSHVKISVMDMKGNVLLTPTDKTLNSGPNEVEINASEAGLSAGTYFVNIEVNGQFIVKKIIKVTN